MINDQSASESGNEGISREDLSSPQSPPINIPGAMPAMNMQQQDSGMFPPTNRLDDLESNPFDPGYSGNSFQGGSTATGFFDEPRRLAREQERSAMLPDPRERQDLEVKVYLPNTVLSRTLTRDKEVSDKTRELLGIESLIKNKVGELKKSADMASPKHIAVWLKDLERSCKMVIRYESFMQTLEKHTEGALQRKIQECRKSLACQRLNDGWSDRGTKYTGYKDLQNQCDMDSLQETLKGQRQILPPDYTLMYTTFKQTFIRGLKREWTKAHATFYRHPRFVQGDNESVAVFIDQKFLKVELEEWDEVALGLVPDVLKANMLFAGLREELQMGLQESHPHVINALNHKLWDFHQIAMAAGEVENSPAFKQQQKLRDSIKATHKVASVSRGRAKVEAKQANAVSSKPFKAFHDNIGDISMLKEFLVVAVPREGRNDGKNGKMAEQSAERKAAFTILQRKIEESGREAVNNKGVFDYFSRGGKTSKNRPTCVVYDGTDPRLSGCLKSGHYVTNCPLNQAVVLASSSNTRFGGKPRKKKTQVAAVTGKENVTNKALQKELADAQASMKEAASSNEDLMKMMCCLVTRTTEDPEDLVPFKKVLEKYTASPVRTYFVKLTGNDNKEALFVYLGLPGKTVAWLVDSGSYFTIFSDRFLRAQELLGNVLSTSPKDPEIVLSACSEGGDLGYYLNATVRLPLADGLFKVVNGMVCKNYHLDAGEGVEMPVLGLVDQDDMTISHPMKKVFVEMQGQVLVYPFFSELREVLPGTISVQVVNNTTVNAVSTFEKGGSFDFDSFAQQVRTTGSSPDDIISANKPVSTGDTDNEGRFHAFPQDDNIEAVQDDSLQLNRKVFTVHRDGSTTEITKGHVDKRGLDMANYRVSAAKSKQAASDVVDCTAPTIGVGTENQHIDDCRDRTYVLQLQKALDESHDLQIAVKEAEQKDKLQLQETLKKSKEESTTGSALTVNGVPMDADKWLASQKEELKVVQREEIQFDRDVKNEITWSTDTGLRSKLSAMAVEKQARHDRDVREAIEQSTDKTLQSKISALRLAKDARLDQREDARLDAELTEKETAPTAVQLEPDLEEQSKKFGHSTWTFSKGLMVGVVASTVAVSAGSQMVQSFTAVGTIEDDVELDDISIDPTAEMKFSFHANDVQQTGFQQKFFDNKNIKIKTVEEQLLTSAVDHSLPMLGSSYVDLNQTTFGSVVRPDDPISPSFQQLDVRDVFGSVISQSLVYSKFCPDNENVTSFVGACGLYHDCKSAWGSSVSAENMTNKAAKGSVVSPSMLEHIELQTDRVLEHIDRVSAVKKDCKNLPFKRIALERKLRVDLAKKSANLAKGLADKVKAKFKPLTDCLGYQVEPKLGNGLTDVQALLDSDMQPRKLYDVKRSPSGSYDYVRSSTVKVSALQWNEYRKVDTNSTTMFEKAGLASNEWANEPVNFKILTEALESHAEVFQPNADGTLKRVLNRDGSLYEVALQLTTQVPVRSGTYRMAPAIAEKIKLGVLEMERLGVVKRQLSQWGAQCLAIKKCDGETRIVTDFIKLNMVMENYSHPSMTESDVYHIQYGMSRWTKIDLTKFYWQISLAEESKKYTGFTVPGLGSFVYEVLPMGVKQACAIAQALAEDCFRVPYDGPGPMHGKIALGSIIINWMDDLLLFSADDEYHAHYVAFALKVLHKRNVQASLKKAHIGVTRVGMIGHILDRDGLHPDPEKIKAVLEMPIPFDVASLRRLLGMAQYLSKFVVDYAMITAPLSDLLQKDVKWEMTPRRIQAVQELTKALTQAPVLQLPNFGLKFVVRCDASKLGMGTEISQVYDGVRLPIAFFSRKFRGAELNYGVRGKECKAIQFGVRKCREYTQGSHFFLITDHKNLLFMKSATPTDVRIWTAALELSQHCFTLVHAAGTTLVGPDTLSRAALDCSESDDDGFIAEAPNLDKEVLFPTEKEAINLVGKPLRPKSNVVQSGLQATATAAATKRKKKPKTVISTSLVCFDHATTGGVNVLVGIESSESKKGQLSVPGGKLSEMELTQHRVDEKLAVQTALIREVCEETGADLALCGDKLSVALGSAIVLEVVKNDVRHVVHVFEIWREDLPVTVQFGEGKGKNPLQQVGWKPVEDVIGHEDVSYVLNWACSKMIRKMLISKRSPLPIVQPSQSGNYNVLVMNYGLNTDGQAVEGSQFKIIGGTESDAGLVKHFQDRGYKHLGSSDQLLKNLQFAQCVGKSGSSCPTFKVGSEKEAQKNNATNLVLNVHVLAAKCGLQLKLQDRGIREKRSLHFFQEFTLKAQVDQVLGVVSITMPSAIFLRLPTPNPLDVGFDVYGEVESKLATMGYEVTVDIVNSAQYGDYTANKLYVLVAVSKMGGPFTLPTVLNKFTSAKEVLSRPAVVHPRLREKLFQQLNTVMEVSQFEPKLVGNVTRGCISKLSAMYALSNPLPEFGSEFEYNGVNGAQWIQDTVGPRLLCQSEMARCINLDSTCQAFLANSDKKTAQIYVSNSTPVATVSAFYASILPVLEKITAAANSPLGNQNMTVQSRVVANVVSYHFPSISTIKDEQAKESDIAVMIQYVSLSDKERTKAKKPSSKYVKDLPFLRMQNGILFYRHELGDGQVLTDSVVLPIALHDQVLKALHDSPFYGHPGQRATVAEVKARCYWAPHMGKDIIKYVKRCLACARAKAFRRNFAGTPRRQLYWQRDDCHCWDFIGPFVSVDGFCYIAHGTNACTGFNYGGPVKNKETITCAEAMHETFMRSGWPKKVVTDNGKEFASKLQEALAVQLGYQGVRCCPLSPKGNTFVEGRHRQINALLKIAVKYYGKNWVKGIPYIFFAVNGRGYKETEICPFEMEYASPPPSAADLEYDEDLDSHGIPKRLKLRMSPEEWIRSTKQNIENAIAVVNKAKTMTMVDNIKRENERFYTESHDQGDMVFVHRPICKKGKTSRLLFQNIGPFEVVEPGCPANANGSYNAYKLKCIATGKISPFNVRDISPYLKKNELREMNEEKDAEDDGNENEELQLVNPEFSPVVGDFLLFTGFKDVQFHLIRVTAPVEDGIVKFHYFNTISSKRLVGFAKVWTHQSKKEIFANSIMGNGYECEEHEVAVSDVAQKVIVPEKYMRNLKPYFKMTQEQVIGVLRYSIE